MRIVGLVLLIAFFMATTFEAEAAKKKSPPDKATIEFRKGGKLYRKKKYDQAVKAYRKAYEIKSRWKYLYHIGRSEAAAGQPVLALASYEAYLAKGQKRISKKRRKSVRRRM